MVASLHEAQGGRPKAVGRGGRAVEPKALCSRPEPLIALLWPQQCDEVPRPTGPRHQFMATVLLAQGVSPTNFKPHRA